MYIKAKDEEYEVRYGNGDKPKATDELICSFTRLEVAVDFIRYLRGDNVENDYRIKGALNVYQDRKRKEKKKKKSGSGGGRKAGKLTDNPKCDKTMLRVSF